MAIWLNNIKDYNESLIVKADFEWINTYSTNQSRSSELTNKKKTFFIGFGSFSEINDLF